MSKMTADRWEKEKISGPDNSKYRDTILYVKKLYEQSEGKVLLSKFIKSKIMQSRVN